MEAQIDCLIKRGEFSEAFAVMENHACSLKTQNADILQRVTMLLAKAQLFSRVGKPEAGFSVALRAATVAFKARLTPSLWLAVGLLCNILNSLGEFQAAVRLFDAILPQVGGRSGAVHEMMLY